MPKELDKDAAWLRIDERRDVLASLSLCLKCLKSVQDDPALWKWAILSLHNALQGAMTCHLSGTAQLGALSDKAIKAWLDWHQRDLRGEIERTEEGFDELGIRKRKIVNREDHLPNSHLADTKELFKRLYSDGKRPEEAGAVLSISPDEQESFRRLHGLRNEFSHFTPKGWAIELTGLPSIFLNIHSVLKKISTDPWPFRHLDQEERARLSDLLNQLHEQLEYLRGLSL